MALQTNITNPGQLSAAQLAAQAANKSKKTSGGGILQFIKDVVSPDVDLFPNINMPWNAALRANDASSAAARNLQNTTSDLGPALGKTDTEQLESFGTGSGSSASGADLAYIQDQIGSLDRLLGYYGSQKQAGLENIINSAAKAKADATKQFEEQRLANQKARLSGLEDVGSFANQSYENLNRLLQGAKAGRSSVAQELVPYLISKGAGSRRQGVVQTAGENERSIQKAQNESDYSLEEERKKNEREFLQSILEKENEMLSEKQQLETQRDMARGLTYNQARQASLPTQIALDERMNQLKNLFSTYKPSYTVAETPELSKYTVDKATIQAGSENATPSSINYYLQQLKKKNEENQV